MRLYTVVFSLFISSAIFSQVTEFRVADNDFLDDIENYIKNYDKSLSKELKSELKSSYVSGFNAKQKEKIVSFANELIKKKINPKPYFFAYFKSINGLGKTENLKKEEFDSWSNLMTKLLESRNKRRLTDFLILTDGLFNQNYISESSSVIWKLAKGTYKFSYKKGAFVTFENSNFVCISKNDSSIIYGASGVLNVSTNTFKGNKGTVTWERLELPKNETFAELSTYRINFKSAGFGADSVALHSPFFTNPLLGKLYEKVITFTSIDRARYPHFTSYNQSVVLKNIVPNVDYLGSFSLIGINFEGGATGKNKASIIVNKEGEKFIEIKSKNVIISNDKIVSNDASATVFIKKGEQITQSACDFTYQVAERLAIIGAVRNINIDNPFESSYHKMNMHFKSLSWKEGEEKLTFGSVKSLGASEATFESVNYYNQSNYSEFTFGSNNLIQSLYDYQLSFEENYEISAVDFASYTKSLFSEVSNYLTKMSNLGLIDYNVKDKTITIKPKLYTYVQGRTRSGDYDDVFIFSVNKKEDNAILDLKTLTISVIGVRKFDLSKRKFVRIYPRGGKITIGENRSLTFSGVINAGRTEYFGSDIKFDYKQFTLQFEKVDSMRIRVYPLDNKSSNKQLKLLSKLHNIKGEITIDGIENKSGKDMNFAHYPRLSVSNNPKIYYDNNEIYGGIYEKENFYFEVAPFDMDSLLTFNSSGISFSGTMYSADIFPPLEREVKLMDDYTLGFFLKNVSKNIYKSPGKYNNELKLSTKGLTGKGEVSFITSKANSKEITFFPDSLVAKVDLYTNKSQTLPSVPDIIGKNCIVTFQPHKGIWKTKNIDSSINLYADGKTKFNGEITLTKDKMTGKGVYTSNRIEVNSQEFVLGQINVDAALADFKILGLIQNDPPSLEATNMQMSLDYTKRRGDFISNTKTAVIAFPLNKFKASIDEFDWLMDENTMHFKKVIDTANFQNYDENKNLISNFVSTKEEQYNLGFFSRIATYNIDSNSIYCQEIPYIIVADSRIIPHEGKLTILKDAEIKVMKKATIVANFTTRYHNFSNAVVEIESSKRYIATGDYQVSSDEMINSKVFFSNIEPNENGVSIAEGTISEDSNFYLSPQFRYYGNIKVKGSDLGVNFDGQTKIITNCEELALDWIKFNAVVDTNKIIIPLGDYFKDKVSGPTLSRYNGVEFYTAFLADKKYEGDEAITPADGFLSYSKEKGLFEIGPKEKLLNNKVAGNYIGFDDEICSFVSIGDLNVASNLSQMKIELVGEMSYNKLKDTFLTMNASMKIDFPVNMQLMGRMYQEIRAVEVQELISLESTNYDLFLNQMLDNQSASAKINEIYTSGRFSKFPKELMSKITLFDLQFYWDKNTESFLSQGFANIASLGTNQLYRRCKVYVQIEKRRTGDRVGFLIEYKPEGFYYFYYKNGEMQTYSTDKVYNNIVQMTPVKEKKIKGGKDEEDFYYGLSSLNKPLLFMRNFQSDLEERFDDEEDDYEDEEENEDTNDEKIED
tara:strand:+ start:2210 stop:6712 length:4503 start_codon:yes stop_codon:yes gene_type:complete